jgi:o-succinylbenzoate synthase
MIISDFKVYELNIPLKTPFKIADSTQTEYNGIILELRTIDGVIGWGEAAPSTRVTGETQTTVKEILEYLVKPKILDHSLVEIEKMMVDVESEIPYQPSACCALDIALHDLKGKQVSMPIKHLIDGFRDEIPISFTVVIGSVAESLKSAQEYLDQGAKVLKVKLGVDPDEDVKRIKALRDAFGYDILITGDANQGYSVKQAINTLNQLSSYELEFVEQPVAAVDLKGLTEVHKAVEVPIMADECAQSVTDVMNLVKLNAVDMVNIKLMKCGGLRNAVKIANITEGADITCQIGCMIETGVGITAGTHLALGHKNIKYADLDGNIFLKKDIISNHQITKNGVNTISGRPGLGIEVSI